MSFSPNLFISNIKAKGGPAKASRYEVVLPIPNYIGNFVENSFWEKLINFPNTFVSDISDKVGEMISKTSGKTITENSRPAISRYLALQCESAELPGKSLQTADVKIYGPTFKVPYQTQYQETTLNFICTNDFYERKLFDRWLEAIMPTDTNNLRFPKGSESRYMTTIKIAQYNEFVKQIYAVELIDAFPISIASQPLSWSDENFHRLSVQFSFQKYRTIYEGTYDPGQILSTLFGSAGARISDQIGRGTSDILGSVF